MAMPRVAGRMLPGQPDKGGRVLAPAKIAARVGGDRKETRTMFG